MEGLELGLVEFNWNFVYQVINTIFLSAIIYGIFYLLFRRSKRRREENKRIDMLEQKIHELNKKLDER